MLKLLGFFLLTAGVVMLFLVIYTGQLIWLVAFLAFFFLGITFLFVERVEEIAFRGLGTIKLAPPRAPSNPLLAIVPEDTARLWWHSGSNGENPIMQVVGDIHFANTSPTDYLTILKSFLEIYFLRWGFLPTRHKVEGMIAVKEQTSDFHGRYEIPAREITTGRAMWFVEPPLFKLPHPLRAKAGFIDQFGKEHWTPILNWKYL
jgi:hypothetical protein